MAHSRLTSWEQRDAVPAPETPSQPPQVPHPWQLPEQGLAVFHGSGETVRLSHYFLPRLLLSGKRVLFLDGANCADPRLIARFAHERGMDFRAFSRQIRIARAFTCFQLTELITRVPGFLQDFATDVLMVTAVPELYFDEDVRDWDAGVAFRQALAGLRRASGVPGAAAGDRRTAQTSPLDRGDETDKDPQPERPLTVAVFTAAPTFQPPPTRARFFAEICAAATEVWQFQHGTDGHLSLARSSSPRHSSLVTCH
ncbi:MAG TPA: hypothetical protein VMX16_16510 [Terriglobia bacterium]|nr:hypothetical protein [Terriglobia bacterium]